jgi:hypothetical protein
VSARLTDLERAERAVTGAQLQRLITDLAVIWGWQWCHFRALQNRRGIWQVPVEGPLGTGWPDLFLAHPSQRTILGVEVKRQLEYLTPDQMRVHAVLGLAGLPIVTWRPSDLRDPVDESVAGRILAGRARP